MSHPSRSQIAQTLIDAGEAGIWEQMEAVLLRRLEADPSDANNLSRLGGLARQRGDLETAAKYYGKAAAMDANDRAARLLAAACQERSVSDPIPRDEMGPAPFLLRRNFLSEAHRFALFELVKQYRNKMARLEITSVKDGKVTDAIHDRELRNQLGVYCETELRPIFEPACEALWDELMTSLQLPSFRPRPHTLRLGITPDDGHTGIHQDIGFGAQIIYLYYFHTHPKAFRGGDLLIHDLNPEENRPAHDQFTMIKHEDNTLVAFPPQYFHQVTRVRALQPDTALEDLRLSVTGFVHPETR